LAPDIHDCIAGLFDRADQRGASSLSGMDQAWHQEDAKKQATFPPRNRQSLMANTIKGSFAAGLRRSLVHAMLPVEGDGNGYKPR